MTDTTLGQRIAEGRKKLGLSQESFGDRLGVSRQAASKWESDAAVPEIDKLITMSKLFGVSIGWLLGVEDPEAPSEATLSEEQLSAVTELLCRYPTPCPERKTRKWLIASCAAGIAVSIAVGTVGLFLPKAASGDTALQSQIDDLTGQNEQLRQQLADLPDQFNGTIEDQSLKLEQLETVLEQLEAKLEASEPDTENPSNEPDDNITFPEQIYPANDLLDSWSLSPKLEAETDSAVLRFSGFTETEAAEARLIAILGGYEIASTVCQRTDVGYAGELELPRVDGYTYFFELTNADGTTKRTKLTGHGLTNLSGLGEPTLHCVTEGPAQMGPTSFWLPKPSIVLEATAPVTAACAWTELQVVYYCNGEAVDRMDLSKEVGGLPRSEHRLEFEVYNIIFPMADRTNSSTHSLRLEGTLEIGGLAKSFSLSLGDWQIYGRQLTEAH